MSNFNIAVFVSGGGTNLQALIDAQNESFFGSRIKLVVSNKAGVYALERATKAGIDTVVCNDDAVLMKELAKRDINLVVLSGYLRIISEELIAQYPNRIINIHPALLPKFGGKGMYGHHVHQAVFEAKEQISGATVHYVTPVIDGGAIILQQAVDISACSSPDEIQQVVLTAEHSLLKQSILLLENS